MSETVMDQHPKQNRPLSEISHLFLSSVRDRQTNGAQRPVRRPPGAHEPRPHVSIDLTPEEFAEVFGGPDALDALDAGAEAPDRTPRVTAVISAHLNGTQHERVKQYARHLAASGQRIGLLEVDTYEFRLMCFDCGTPAMTPAEAGVADGPHHGAEAFDARKMAEAIDEMSLDIDRWLLVLPNPRTPEARALLREVDHWAMLSTCDHDGVVSCYRMLKGLSDMHRPALTLALLDVHDEHQAYRVFRKLGSVCEQFLRWPVTAEPAIETADHVAEHLVMLCRPTRDKAQLAAAPQWQIAANFLAQMKAGGAGVSTQSKTHDEQEAHPMSMQAATTTATTTTTTTAATQPASHPRLAPAAAAEPRTQHVADVVLPTANAAAATASPSPALSMFSGADRESGKELPVASSSPAAAVAATNTAKKPHMTMTTATTAESHVADVMDLPCGDGADSASIITAIVRQAAGGLIECPVRPPMCPDAHLTIDRDRQLTLLAVAGEGLADLRAIAQAYRWLMENRALVAMALPQFAIDALSVPRLRLLVNHADVSAELLQPMLQSGNVTVQAYRKLRWGGKLGLLLEAA